MSNSLITTDKIEKLPVNQKYFVLLRTGNKSIKDLEPNVVKRECADIISKAFFDSGQKLGENSQESQKVLIFQTEALFSELTGVYANLTLPELKECFRRGVRNDSGQWFGLCGKTYHQFIKWFYNLPERQKSWVDFLTLIETPPEPKIDKLLFSKESCIRAFQHYKQSKRSPLAAFAYYDIINDLIGIPYKNFKTLLTDSVQRKEIHDKTLESFITQMSSVHKKEARRGNLSLAESIMLEISNEFKGNKAFENILKEQYLLAFFDKLILENKDLEL